jgi:hypothetical protein
MRMNSASFGAGLASGFGGCLLLLGAVYTLSLFKAAAKSSAQPICTAISKLDYFFGLFSEALAASIAAN